MKEAQSKGLKNVLENQRKFLLVHSSSGHKYVGPCRWSAAALPPVVSRERMSCDGRWARW